MRTRTIATILLAGLLGAGAAQAQLWRGPAAIEIEAKDQKRGPVSGGEVKLVCRSIEPADGPPAVTLDAKGRVVVSGLAEGKWHVEVSKETYMTFQADLDVRADRKPKILSTLQLNVQHAVHMMDVLFYKGKPGGEAIAAAPPPPAVEHRRPTPPPAPAPAPAPETPVETVTKPAPPIEHVTKPVVPRETPPVPVPTPAPPQPSTTPPVPAPVPQPPTPAPAMTPPPAPQPSAAPAPPQTVRRRSYDDRTCFECKPGEASLSVEAVVAPGTEGCGAAVHDLLAKPAGSALPAGCRVLRLSLPPGTRYTGYRYEVLEGSDELDCQAGKDCPGGGRWPLEPAISKGAAGTTLAAAFEGNPSVTRERRAVFTVYYTAGKGK